MNLQQDSVRWIIDIRSAKFILLIGIFAVLSILVSLHLTDAFDLAVSRFFNSIQSSRLDGIMIDLTVSADLTTLFAVSVVLVLVRRTRRLGLAALIVLVASSILLMYFKPVVARPPPPLEFNPRIPLPDKFTLEQDVISFTHVPYSFPSGHETRSAAFAFLIAYFLVRKYGKIGILIWAYPVAVGVSRLYVLAHYTTDLMAAAVLGIVIANMTAKILKFDRHPIAHDTKFQKEKT